MKHAMRRLCAGALPPSSKALSFPEVGRDDLGIAAGVVADMVVQMAEKRQISQNPERVQKLE
jgi:hypothetical protein